MTKTIVTKRWFVREYNRLSGADEYWWFFELEGNVYCYKCKHLPYNRIMMGFESSSKGGHYKAKLGISKTFFKELIVKNKASYFCTMKELQKVEVKKNQNNGHRCEKILAETFPQKNWILGGNERFDKGGDLIIDGKQIQVKFGAASLTNINTLHNAQKEARKNKKRG